MMIMIWAWFGGLCKCYGLPGMLGWFFAMLSNAVMLNVCTMAAIS